jgi:hypothetical protein
VPKASSCSRTGSAWLTGPVLFLMLLIVLVRVTFVVGVMTRSSADSRLHWVMSPDSRDYVYTAEDFSDGRLDSVSFRTPLYPLFILVTQSILSPRWLLTIVLQQLAAGITALACGAIAGRFCGRPSGIAAALAYLVCPLALIESVVLLPDLMMALALAWAGFFWLKSIQHHDGKPVLGFACLSGLLLGISVLLKPLAMLGFVVPLLHLLLLKRIARGRRILIALAVSLSALALPSAWRIHNLVRFGTPALTSQDSFELAGRMMILAGVTTQEEFWTTYADSLELLVSDGPIIYEDLGCTVVPRGWSGLGGGRFCPKTDVARRDSMFRHVAIEAFLSTPGPVIAAHFTGWPLFFANPVGDLDRAGGSGLLKSLVRAGSMVFQIALLAGATLALLSRRVRRDAGALLVFAAIWFVYCAVVLGPLAGTRYSLSFYWILVPVASCGWLSIFGKGGDGILEDRRR